MFIAISENLNAGWADARKAIENRDASRVLEIARRAVAGGAKALNVSGVWGLDGLCWLLETLAKEVTVSMVIDSPDPEVQDTAMARYLAIHGGAPPELEGVPALVTNSITGERERYDAILPVVKKYGAGVIALCMDDDGLPTDAAGRIAAGTKLITRLLEDGIAAEKIFADPLVMPVAVNGANGVAVADTVRELKRAFPEVHVTCGLSNVSHGLPERGVLNAAFLSMLVAAGLDSAIMDTCDNTINRIPGAAMALSDRDPFCAEYIAAFRNSRLDV